MTQFRMTPYAIRRRRFPYDGFLRRRGVRPLASHWHAIRSGTPKVRPASTGGYKPWGRRNGYPFPLVFIPGYWLKEDFQQGRTPVGFYMGKYSR
jgi:hypothetical protein